QCGDDEGMSALSCSYMLPDSSSNNYNDNLTYFDKARLSIEENQKLNDVQSLPCLLNKKTATIHKDDTYLSINKTKSTNNKQKEESCFEGEFQQYKRSRFDFSKTSQQFLCSQIRKVNKKNSCLNDGKGVLGEFASDISDNQTFEQPSSISSAISHHRQVLSTGMADKGWRRKKPITRLGNNKPTANSIPLSTENKQCANQHTSKLSKDVVIRDYCQQNTWAIHNSLAYTRMRSKRYLSTKPIHSVENILPNVSFYPSVFCNKNIDQTIEFNQRCNFVFSKTYAETSPVIENPISVGKRNNIEPQVKNIKFTKKKEGYLLSYDIVNLPLFFLILVLNRMIGFKLTY
ncbi:hypothetical protein CDIK_3927, partial [Cucumispora dikerogammari]